MGVARISVGSSAMTAVMGYVRDIARELRETGTYEQIARHPYSFGEATKLFSK
jgi:2-methylisocitrate lyase-like PEP mutase family enzyme